MQSMKQLGEFGSMLPPPLRSVLRLFLGTELVVLLTDDLVGIYVCAAKVSTSYKTLLNIEMQRV